jgi:hypothetical protein
MLPGFNELRKVDVLPCCDMRDAKDDKGKDIKVPYLNWAKCIDLLHEHGAETVYFTPLTNANGSSLFMSDVAFAKDDKAAPNRCYEVAIEVVIDDKTFVMRGPVMNGSNPVRDNSMSQQRVWNAQTRAFVKGVAIHTGLGFDLWCKAEDSEENNAPKEEDLSIHKIMKIKDRIFQLITEKLSQGKSMDDVAEVCGYQTRDEFELVLKTHFATINNIEARLRKDDSK